MPFPNLTRVTGRTNLSQGVGVPDNGINEFLHDWDLDPDQIEERAIELTYFPQGASVTAIAFVGLSADKLSLRINFTQTGADAVQVIARHTHTIDL